MSQIGNHPQVGVKIKNIWNHQLVLNCGLSTEMPCTKRSQKKHLQAGQAWKVWFQLRVDGFRKSGEKTTSDVHRWKLTCPLKKDYFSREYIFQPLIFRGHVSRGVYLVNNGINYQPQLVSFPDVWAGIIQLRYPTFFFCSACRYRKTQNDMIGHWLNLLRVQCCL